MKQFLLGVGALALTVSLAAAADLPARNLPVRQAPAPLFSFTGFTMGLAGGGQWQRDSMTETLTCPCGGEYMLSGTSTALGAFGGGFVGYSLQFNSLVLGVEADLSAGDIHHKDSFPQTAPDSFSSRLLWDASLRARLGYAIDRVLLYVTGGVAFGEIRHRYDRYDLNGTTGAYDFVAAQSFTHHRTGWTLGAGVEYAFAPGWTTRVEYRYTDFGTTTDNPTLYSPPQVFTERHREAFHSLRVGLAYRF